MIALEQHTEEKRKKTRNTSLDYFSFGQAMRINATSDKYRYGFNGKESDPEAVGTGQGLQDYGMRIYNPALGKFLSVDPLTKSYPQLTPYQFASNTPIQAIDLDGLEAKIQVHKFVENKSGHLKMVTRTVKWKDIEHKGEFNGAMGMGTMHYYYSSDGKLVSSNYQSFGSHSVKEMAETLDERQSHYNKQSIKVKEPGAATENSQGGHNEGGTNPQFGDKGLGDGGESSNLFEKFGDFIFGKDPEPISKQGQGDTVIINSKLETGQGTETIKTPARVDTNSSGGYQKIKLEKEEVNSGKYKDVSLDSK